MALLEQVKRLSDLREAIGILSEEYDQKLEPLRSERDILQRSIIDQMKSEKQFSARFSFATVTLAVRKTLDVIDENQVIAYLKKKKLAKEYVAPRLNDSFEAFRKELAKNGEVIPGTSLRESEYISLREASSEDERRKVTA